MGAWAVVLTAADERGLAEAEIAEAGARLRAPATRLGPASAEVLVDAAPALGGLAEALDAVDVNAVPVAGRRKRLLIADMDSTMIGVECIDEMAARAGIGEAVAEITERAMAGALDFEGALRARVRLVAGMSEAMLEGVMADRIRLNPGARVLVRTMAAAGAHTML
ncbi:MAG: phosphoserine phosphatase SerB, partial [Pseudomonadota bacterium]